MPTAIYSFPRNMDNFREAVSYAVSLSGDADTIGTMTGAISGAHHRVEAIPKEWRNELERKDYIERLENVTCEGNENETSTGPLINETEAWV